MTALTKLIIMLLAVFAAVFLAAKSVGILSLDDIAAWLHGARDLSTPLVAMLVCLLLVADLFISVPTLALSMLSGNLLGGFYGGLAALCGVTLQGVIGYFLSRHWGLAVFRFLLRDKQQRVQAIRAFRKHGFAMILLSRAVPMLPEITACLSGVTKLSFAKFLVAWMLSTVPYIFISAYAGSISSWKDPKPAIVVAATTYMTLWCAWLVYRKRIKAAAKEPDG